jgi:antitoxin CptB
MADVDAEMDTRRKRLRFRAWHRGTRETDLILGRFADRHIDGFTPADVAAFERVLDVPDPDIFAWVTGAQPIPEGELAAMLTRILAFHGTT